MRSSSGSDQIAQRLSLDPPQTHQPTVCTAAHSLLLAAAGTRSRCLWIMMNCTPKHPPWWYILVYGRPLNCARRALQEAVSHSLDCTQTYIIYTCTLHTRTNWFSRRMYFVPRGFGFAAARLLGQPVGVGARARARSAWRIVSVWRSVVVIRNRDSPLRVAQNAYICECGSFFCAALRRVGINAPSVPHHPLNCCRRRRSLSLLVFTI